MRIHREVQELMTLWHDVIGPNYRYLANGKTISCYEVALDMARTLLCAADLSSDIVTVEAKNQQLLQVKPPHDGAKWYRHIYCRDDRSMVYDPIFARPLLEKVYWAALFQRPADMRIHESYRFGPH